MGKIRNNNLIIGCLCALGCEILFGLSYVFTKHVTDLASELSLLGWRFFIAFVVMNICVFTGIIKINLRGKKLKPLIAVAFFSPVMYFIGETLGISNTTASESGIFLSCIPVASLIASSLVLHKKPTKRQILGISLTLAGALLTLIAVGLSASFSVPGYSFLMIAIISYAMYSVMVERAKEYTSAEITYIMIIAGTLVFLTLAIGESIINGNTKALLCLPFNSTGFLVGILFQGILCSIVAFFLSNVAISKIGVNRAASFIGVSTVVSILAGVIVLNEDFSIYQTMGAVIILIGVYVANINSPSTGN